MDRWLTNLVDDSSADAVINKVRRSKPADLTDACWSRDGKATKIIETQARSGNCASLYPEASFPREVAGAGIESDIIKCRLKPISPGDYKTPLSAIEMTRLRRIFPTGVCDWTAAGEEQQKPIGPWVRF